MPSSDLPLSAPWDAVGRGGPPGKPAHLRPASLVTWPDVCAHLSGVCSKNVGSSRRQAVLQHQLGDLQSSSDTVHLHS